MPVLILVLMLGCSGGAGAVGEVPGAGLLEGLREWVVRHRGLLGPLGIVSAATFVLSLLAMPVVVILLPQDYFVRHHRQPVGGESSHPFLWRLLSLCKNLLGILLVVGGIAMLVLPGQGILTILIGLALTNFPGKYALERNLVNRPGVHRTLDTIRRRAGKPPFQRPM